MADRRRTARRAGALLAAATLALTAACGGSTSESQDSDGAIVEGLTVNDTDGMNGAVLTSPYTWGEETLTDTADQPFDTKTGLEKPLTLVFFGYTNCPDICQAVMADVTSALSRLSEEQASQVAMWFVTTDPARDTPQVLREYLDRFDPSFEGLTGDLSTISTLADSVHVAIMKGKKLPTGGYEVSHGTPVIGVMPDGSVPILWTEGTSASKLADDLDQILTDGIPEQKG